MVRNPAQSLQNFYDAPTAKKSYLRRDSQLLKDRTHSVFEDMLKELDELRKVQLKKLQNAKGKGDTAHFLRNILIRFS